MKLELTGPDLLKYRLVAFDMDGTLLVEKSSWGGLHTYFGTYESSIDNMRDYEQGKITYDEFMRRDIALWKPRPHISTIEKVLLDYTITPNAENVVKTITQKGIHTAIITSGLDILANSVASRLGICNVAANGLVFDEDGFLTDKVTFRVDLLKKHKAFNELIEKLGIPRNQSVAVGDSRYDTNFLKNAGLGVAYTKDNELASAADITITDLKELLNFL